jgi:hypothetical protein
VERRTFLVLCAAAAGLAGCTEDSSDPEPPSAPPTTAAGDPDARLRDAVAASEVALIGAYRSAIQADPGLAPTLGPFVAQHEAHLARVAPGHSGSSGTASTGSPAASPGAPSAGGTRSVLVGLADAESAAQSQRATACDGAQDPALARELCLIAASEAQHATALAALAERRPTP